MWIPITAIASFGLWRLLGDARWTLALTLVWLVLRLILSIWLPSLAWARSSYALRDTDVLVASGVFLHRMVCIPLNRVQHVDVVQDVLDRWWNLHDVAIYTASGGGVDAVIRGLELADAEALRDALMRAAGHDGT